MDRESLLAAAAFTAWPVNTPERLASLRILQPNRVFQRRLADERAMAVQMKQMSWDEGLWGPFW